MASAAAAASYSSEKNTGAGYGTAHTCDYLAPMHEGRRLLDGAHLATDEWWSERGGRGRAGGAMGRPRLLLLS